MNETLSGTSNDSLKAGAGTSRYQMRCLTMDSGTTIERGALLAGGWDGSGTHVHMATADDTTGAELFIAAKDVNEKAMSIIAYASGDFNREAIKLTEGLDIRAFEYELRKQNILLTEVI